MPERAPQALTAPHPRAEMEGWTVWLPIGRDGSLFVGLWVYRGFEAPGLLASYAYTGATAGDRITESLIDRALLGGVRRSLAHALSERRDPFLEAAHDLTTDDSVFAPYQVANGQVPAPGALVGGLGPCRFEHATEADPTVTIETNELSLSASLELTPEALMAVSEAAPGSHPRQGRVAPRVPARGTLAVRGGGPEPFTGNAVWSQTWGPWALFDFDHLRFHPEWHDFIVRLDPNTSVVARLARQPAPEGRRTSRVTYAWLRRGSETIQLDDLEVRVRGAVESLRTLNRYDHGWTLESKRGAFVLDVDPVHENHEAFVFAPHRAVQEHRCTVRGTLGNAPVRGDGRAEIFGDSPDANEFFWGRQKAALSDELARVVPREYDAAWLAAICGNDEPLAVHPRDVEHALLEPLWSMMDRGGKGWRSAWLTLCCHALGGLPDERARTLLPVIELLHTGSLIIDDIQDDSPTRRGRPALHAEVGQDLAINVGNFLYFLPLIIVERANWLTEPQRARVYAIIAQAMRQGHVGQALDLMWSRRPLSDALADPLALRAELLEQYRLKSGCQLDAIARIAGVVTGAPDDWTGALAHYSRTFGAVFQMLDDVIDSQDAGAKLGKERFEDFANGKLNVVLLELLSTADPATRTALIARMGAGRDPKSHELLERHLSESRVVETVLDAAREMMDAAFDDLSALPRTDALVVMKSVPRWLIAERRSRSETHRTELSRASAAYR